MNIIIYTSCLCLVYATSAKEDISNFAHEDRKFRSVKYNDIWERALKTVPKKDLPELGRMLKKLDKSEIDLKHHSGNFVLCIFILFTPSFPPLYDIEY